MNSPTENRAQTPKPPPKPKPRVPSIRYAHVDHAIQNGGVYQRRERTVSENSSTRKPQLSPKPNINRFQVQHYSSLKEEPCPSKLESINNNYIINSKDYERLNVSPVRKKPLCQSQSRVSTRSVSSASDIKEGSDEREYVFSGSVVNWWKEKERKLSESSGDSNSLHSSKTLDWRLRSKPTSSHYREQIDRRREVKSTIWSVEDNKEVSEKMERDRDKQAVVKEKGLMKQQDRQNQGLSKVNNTKEHNLDGRIISDQQRNVTNDMLRSKPNGAVQNRLKIDVNVRNERSHDVTGDHGQKRNSRKTENSVPKANEYPGPLLMKSTEMPFKEVRSAGAKPRVSESACRMSVFDMVGVFENKGNNNDGSRAKTLGRRPKATKDFPERLQDLKEGKLQRRLSQSAGDLTQIMENMQEKSQEKPQLRYTPRENKVQVKPVPPRKPDKTDRKPDSGKTSQVPAQNEAVKKLPLKPNRTFDQDIYQMNKADKVERRELSPTKPNRTFDQDAHQLDKLSITSNFEETISGDDIITTNVARKRASVRRIPAIKYSPTHKPKFEPPAPPKNNNKIATGEEETSLSAQHYKKAHTISRQRTVPCKRQDAQTRPQSIQSTSSGVVYATPEIPGTGAPVHQYHVLEGDGSVSDDQEAIFGRLARRSPIEDIAGYTVPGSHLWAGDSGGALAIDVLPVKETAPSVSPGSVDSQENRPRSNNNAIPPGVHGYTEPTRPDRTDETADKHKKEPFFKVPFRKSKMRRKIHDAFKSSKSNRTDDDRLSVASEDSDLEIPDTVLKKRLTYVRGVKARTSHYCRLDSLRQDQYSKLYEYAVVVSLRKNEETERYEPCEIRRFPHEVSDSQNDKLRAIPQFCFPDSFKWAPVEQYNSESFSFVLTSSDGSRFYGYNRRLLPPGNGHRLPEVFCVMSPVGCLPVYNQFLDEIEKRRKVSMSAVEILLKEAYSLSLPGPGDTIEILCHVSSGREAVYLQRPTDSRLEQIDFDYLFSCLSIPQIIQIFASLLFERRIIMCSSYLSKLSKCSQAIAALLYPFAWQHVYVPVLPQKLIDMCCSPTPYIMGMLSICIPDLDTMPLEEVLIVDLDARDFYEHVGDENTILPKRLSAALEKALESCRRGSIQQDSLELADKELSEDFEMSNKAISEAFIHFFVEVVGHYINHFPETSEGRFQFDREGFIKGINSKSIKRFLEVFSETQMFSLFIQEKEAESGEGIPQGLFEHRIKEFESERRNNAKVLGFNVKKLGKAVKDSGLKIADTAKGVKVKVKANLDDKI